jgi:hypothetical protein
MYFLQIARLKFYLIAQDNKLLNKEENNKIYFYVDETFLNLLYSITEKKC